MFDVEKAYNQHWNNDNRALHALLSFDQQESCFLIGESQDMYF